MHPTIKFMADWSKKDLTVCITESIIETDLYVKLIDSHQYLLSSFCHLFYCKKGMPYSQVLRLNRICSTNKLKDAMTSGNTYEKMVHKEIL